jgi:hypothetical protein
MGQEAHCVAWFQGRSSPGKAHLGSEDLTFKGEFRLAIPFKDIGAVEARRGRLEIRFGREQAALELGPAAEAWALKIRYPKSLLDKLGVKPDSRVAMIDVPDQGLREQAEQRCGKVADRPRRGAGCDILFYYADKQEALQLLAALQGSIRQDGMIWVLWPKGQKRITGNQVMAAAKEAGLVDVKICSVSETLSGLKLVIPRARRSGR